MKKLKVAELFAGVGGFRLGLEATEKYEVIWSNQWEPNSKIQHASLIYENKFGKTDHISEDIENVLTKNIPYHDVLVGGFPCQDYSVASLLKNSKGLIGKKGVLWWSIYKILEEKKRKPKYLILENVDRLLLSPVTQKGKDFAVILSSLNNLGYAVEWRVVNAADYGMPQRRRRIFIVAYYKNTGIYSKLKKSKPLDWIYSKGLFAKKFKVRKNEILFVDEFSIDKNLTSVSSFFNTENNDKVFKNSGFMIEGKVFTSQVVPVFTGKTKKLNDILEKNKVDSEFYLNEDDLEKWVYEKGAKSKTRTKNGHTYEWKEGSIAFPDNLDKPSRTIITSEGGKSASRIKHVVNTRYGLRRLTPLELERLNMFPDNHTLHDEVTNTKRAFLMGNALVVGVIEKIGLGLIEIIKNE
jgi:DNA (cytosine-5)-methyltransferase 1